MLWLLDKVGMGPQERALALRKAFDDAFASPLSVLVAPHPTPLPAPAQYLSGSRRLPSLTACPRGSHSVSTSHPLTRPLAPTGRMSRLDLL